MKKMIWESPETIEFIAEILSEGAVVVGETDTVPGLFAACSDQGIQALNDLKGRTNKPYLVILSEVSELELWIEKSTLDHVKKIIEHCWPGPLTLVVKACQESKAQLCAFQGAVAIRIPDYEPMRLLAQRMGGVFSTSANYTGDPVPQSLDTLDGRILEAVIALVSREDAAHSCQSVASTIIDCTGEKVVMVREGAYPRKQLSQLLGYPL